MNFRKIVKNTNFWLGFAIVLCLLSMIGTHVVDTHMGKVEVKDINATLTEMSNDIKANNTISGKNITVDFTTGTKNVHFRVFIPKNATADTPAPVIVCAHGASNCLELQMPFYVEMARRGFVVASIDIEGCGETDNAVGGASAFSSNLGMLPVVEWLMSQSYVDETKVALTGHSFGNSGCLMTISALNKPGSTQRIRGWVDGDGLRYIPKLTADMAEGLVFTVGAAMYGESTWPLGYNYTTNSQAKNLVSLFDSSYDGASNLVNGQWYTSGGKSPSLSTGEAIDANSAVRICNYSGTHNMWHFSKTGTKIAIDGFYAALGTPEGVSAIDSDNQIWWIEVVFETLGLIGIFMLIFPLVSILMKSRLFTTIKRPVIEQNKLPSIKDPRRWIVALASMMACAFFTYFSYIKSYAKAGSLFDTTSWPSASANVKALVVWNIVSGIFMLSLLVILHYINKLLFRKDNNANLLNEFESANVASVRQFLTTVLFSGVVVGIFYGIVIFARKVFYADFRICLLAVQFGDLNWFPTIITKYLPTWIMYFVPAAILNANMRYKELPDWLSSLIVALASCVPLLIQIIYQYSTMVKTGVTMPLGSAATILAITTLPPIAFSAFSNRYIYKKTGSAWAAGLINAAVFCIMMCYNGSWAIDVMFI